MQSGPIDRLSRWMAHRASRRSVLSGAAAGAMVASLSGHARGALAQDGTPTAVDDMGTPAAETQQEFLFVQTAASGTFAANPGAGTPTALGGTEAGGGADYLLTLQGHNGHTIYFSDRPERITGAGPTEAFLDGLGFTPINPPNAALVTSGEDGSTTIVVLELLNPIYDQSTQTITYGATILDEYDDAGLQHLIEQGAGGTPPESFTGASLFIDDCPDITECVSMAMRNIPVPVGPVPGGPYGTCWSWSSFACHLCSSSVTGDDLNRMCNQQYEADCGNNQCYAM
jgi:hypothetical protein